MRLYNTEKGSVYSLAKLIEISIVKVSVPPDKYENKNKCPKKLGRKKLNEIRKYNYY